MKRSNMSEKEYRIFQTILITGSYVAGITAMYLIFVAYSPESKYRAGVAWASLWFIAPTFLGLSFPYHNEMKPNAVKYIWIGALAICYMALGMATFLMGR